MRWIALVAVMILAVITSQSATAGNRVALIIANSKYNSVPVLNNPPADAILIEKSLKDVGFNSVDVVQNLGKAELELALQRFASKADSAEVALVYYAGHGIEIGGRNYIIPVSARLLRDRDADFEAVPLDTVVRALETAKLKLVILDACRENPFAVTMARTGQGRSIGRGLARVEPEGDTLIVYAAKAGAIAADGATGNSPFATALAYRIREPGAEISMMFRRVRDDVLRTTNRSQEPFTYGSLSGEEFYFVPAGAGAIANRPNSQLTETLLWQGAMAAGTEASYQDYLSRYPTGMFATAARENLKRFLATESVVSKGKSATSDDVANYQPSRPVQSPGRLNLSEIERPSTGDSIGDRYIYGFRLWQEKYYAEAQTELKMALNMDENSSYASKTRHLLGRSYLDDNKPALASVAFYENYQKLPRGDRALNSLIYLADALLRLKKPGDACKVYKEANEVYRNQMTNDLKIMYDKGWKEGNCR